MNRLYFVDMNRRNHLEKKNTFFSAIESTKFTISEYFFLINIFNSFVLYMIFANLMVFLLIDECALLFKRTNALWWMNWRDERVLLFTLLHPTPQQQQHTQCMLSYILIMHKSWMMNTPYALFHHSIFLSHFFFIELYSLINKTILHNLCIAFIIVLLLLPYLIFFFCLLEQVFHFHFLEESHIQKKRNALGFCPLYKNSPLFMDNHF